MNTSTSSPEDGRVQPMQRPLAEPARRPDQKSNYELLTATTLIYAIGAGITAAAGTRLALQLILDKGFKLFSFLKSNRKRLD